jgi:hypothetical protein
MAKRAEVATGRPSLKDASRAMEWPQPPTAPRWMAWAPPAAILWALAYGVVRVWWVLSRKPLERR